jgi:hypothetical protein
MYLSLVGLHKGRPSCRRSLQSSKQNIQHTMKFITFFLFVRVIFAFLISDPDRESESGFRDPIESGSNPDPQHWLKGWFLSRIRIHNTVFHAQFRLTFSIKKKNSEVRFKCSGS